MITIPVWVFVLLIVLASITALELLLILISALVTLFTPVDEYEETYCPEELEPADVTDDPEAMPKVTREE